MEFVQLAQIVADQCVSYGALQKPEAKGEPLEGLQSRTVIDQFVEKTVSFHDWEAHRCTLGEFASLDLNARKSGRRPQVASHAVSTTSEKSSESQGPGEQTDSSISLLRIPDVVVKRGDFTLEIASTALEFWKELGLGPVKGTKDTWAFCVFPDTPLLQRAVGSLLEAIRQTYISLRFGNHSTGHSSMKDYSSGRVAFPISSSESELEGNLTATCERFGT